MKSKQMTLQQAMPELPKGTLCECDGVMGVMYVSEQVYEVAFTYAESLRSELEAAKDVLQFVERWANHHGAKPHMTAEQALGCIQH